MRRPHMRRPPAPLHPSRSSGWHVSPQALGAAERRSRLRLLLCAFWPAGGRCAQPWHRRRGRALPRAVRGPAGGRAGRRRARAREWPRKTAAQVRREPAMTASTPPRLNSVPKKYRKKFCRAA